MTVNIKDLKPHVYVNEDYKGPKAVNASTEWKFNPKITYGTPQLVIKDSQDQRPQTKSKESPTPN